MECGIRISLSKLILIVCKMRHNIWAKLSRENDSILYTSDIGTQNIKQICMYNFLYQIFINLASTPTCFKDRKCFLSLYMHSLCFLTFCKPSTGSLLWRPQLFTKI